MRPGPPVIAPKSPRTIPTLAIPPLRRAHGDTTGLFSQGEARHFSPSRFGGNA